MHNQYEEEEEQPVNSLPYKIATLENHYADNVLTGDLKELYAQVQSECGDFRQIFIKNLELFDDRLGNLSKQPKKNKTREEKDLDFEELLREIKSPNELMEIFSEEARKTA